jgi:hypothetical protein
LLWFLLLLPSLHAAGQTAERAERGDARELRRDGLLAAQEQAERGRPPVDQRLLLGVAYTDAESGERRWAIPFEYRVRFNERRTYLKASGDGYVDSRSDEGDASGLANVNLAVTHRLAEGWRGTLGITLPTGGEVGSERGRERVGLSYERDLWERWSGLIKLQLVRYDADPEPGESRMRRQGLVQIAYTFDADTLALAQFERFHRPGVTSASVATLGYQMSVGRTASGPVVGALTFSRGLSEGLRDTTIELDVCLKF